MKLFIARHGESQASEEGIGLGQLDGGLSEKGLMQARQLARRLAKEPLDVIFASPLQRATETAREITLLRPDSPLLIEERLKERSMGIFEGRPKKLFEKACNGQYGSYTPPGGESIAEVVDRAMSFYFHLRSNFKSKAVAIISHNFLNKALLAIVLQRPVEEIIAHPQDNACLNIVELDDETDEPKLVKINDVEHLVMSRGM